MQSDYNEEIVFSPSKLDISVVAGVALATLFSVPWISLQVAGTEVSDLAPLLERCAAPFSFSLRLVSDQAFVIGLVVAISLAALASVIALFRLKRRLARALVATAAIGGLALSIINLAAVREARELTLPDEARVCPCPDALFFGLRGLCACKGDRLVARWSFSMGKAPVTSFHYDAQGRVTAVEIRPDGSASAIARTCAVEPPALPSAMDSASLRCVEKGR